MSGELELVRVWFCSSEADFARLLGRTLGPQFELHFGSETAPPDNGQTSVVLVDLRDSAGFLKRGLELIDQIQQGDLPPAVIPMLSSENEALRHAVIDKGVYGTVNCPPEIIPLRALIERAHTWARMRRQADGLTRSGPRHQRVGNLIVTSQAMQKVVLLARKVAACDVTALITGETGTGKELVTRAIHEMSGRSNGPFVAFSCANLPESLVEDELFGHDRGAFTGAVGPRAGRFEMANGGTLFLDEVGDLPLSSQAKLLRVLQERSFERLGSIAPQSVDIRLVCATHRDLEQMVRKGTFRQDLYYRLNVMQIHIPPLRERPDGIPALAQAFLERFSQQFGKAVRGFSSAALKALQEHPWPGNVRQLENVIQRAVALAEGQSIEVQHLPFAEVAAARPAGPGDSYDEQVKNFKRRLVRRVLEESRGNKTAAARRLQVARGYLHRLIQQLEVDGRDASNPVPEEIKEIA